MIVVNLALLACAFTLRAADDPSVIRVAARYPGANAQVIDSRVALPLLRQIHGVEGATCIETESTIDGTCTITIRLDAKADPAKVQDVVRKRVALAEPGIPELCKRRGITVRTEPVQPVEFWCTLTKPDDPHDDATILADHARGEYGDVLGSIPGVREVRVLGTADFLGRITLDVEKLKVRATSVEDVQAAVQATNDVVAVSTIDSSPKGTLRLMVRSSARFSTVANAFGEIVVKTGGKGQQVLLRDVGQVELGSMMPNELTTF